ncbi:hypothetical protein HMPREF1199_01003 [Hoylesella oralis CC98A]|nr:hypothetical protein HMPREF1199_01003 [Hoylesella oralis CC98A]
MEKQYICTDIMVGIIFLDYYFVINEVVERISLTKRLILTDC